MPIIPTNAPSYRPKHAHLRRYLQSYKEDRALVWLTVQKQRVDEIYHADPMLQSWRAYWHQRTGTPYLERNGSFIFPEGTNLDDQTQIEHEHRNITND